MSRLVAKRTRELLILNAYLLFLKNWRWCGLGDETNPERVDFVGLCDIGRYAS